MDDDLPANKKAYTVSFASANLFAILFLLPVALIFLPPFLWAWGLAPLVDVASASPIELLLSLLVLFIGIVIHELLHGLTWRIAGRLPAGAIQYGIHWKVLTPYAHCKAPMNARAYRLGGAMPGLALGVLPVVLSLLVGNGWLLTFGLLFTWAAAGDFLILWLLRAVPPNALVEDHPSLAGCYVLENGTPT